MAAPAVSFSNEADMKKLIGTNIKNSAGDTVGEVKSVLVDKSGKIQDVIVSVGGFLGMGDREVALSWNDLTVTDEGKHVTTTMTKDALKALPEYKYKQATYRGTVFRD
jgi:sporulation protein YlmC with PRC-barrel domain